MSFRSSRLIPRVALVCALLPLGSVQAMAAPSFGDCVRALHKAGGLSLIAARGHCLSRPSETRLRCQNELFLFTGFSPARAWERCAASTSTPGYSACVGERVLRQGEERESAAQSCANDVTSGASFRFPAPPAGRFEPLPHPRSGKKTVCSITVNSSDERELFRKLLPKDRFQHVELLPNAAQKDRFHIRDERWLNRACQSDLRCDVVVISGHFAGTFLGTSGFDVSVAPLLQRSCSDSCPGLFSAAKEVYLFGCNTLAGKNADSRTPGRYRDVLLEDGLDPAEAQRIAARRYTEYGPSFRTEMRRLFPNARRIYGFPSVGPSGPNIAPRLSAYLRALPDYANELERRDSSAIERAFRTHLAPSGAIATDGAGDEGGARAQACADPLSTPVSASAFSRRWGTTLPVPAWDLIARDERAGRLGLAEAQALRTELVRNVRRGGDKSARRLLCPITLDFGRKTFAPLYPQSRCEQPDWI